jgi:hypothetical protein
MKRFNLGFGFWFGIVVTVLFGGVLWYMFSQEASKRSFLETAPTREIAFTCTTDMATQFHIHPNLKIVIDGKQMIVPANIGITNACMSPLHTHDEEGTLHVESPIKRDFTLGDFFAVWKQPLSNAEFMDKKVGAEGTLVMTINDKVVDTLENTVLVDQDKIVLTYTSK